MAPFEAQSCKRHFSKILSSQNLSSRRKKKDKDQESVSSKVFFYFEIRVV